jgi:hypothetical protein
MKFGMHIEATEPVCLCIPPIIVRQMLDKMSLLGNGPANMFPPQNNARNNKIIVGRVCLWVCLLIPLSLLRNGSVKTFPRQGRIVGGVVFYEVCIVSKESGRLGLPERSVCITF